MDHVQRGQSDTARLFARQHGVISRRQGLAAGLTTRAIEWRLASGEWLRVHPGVYRLATAPVTSHQRLVAACLAMGGVASHRSAARLLGLDIETELVEVTKLGGARRPKGVLLRRTRSRAGERVVRDGIPCTSPSRTLLDLAAVVDELDLEAALDAALREGLTSIGYLEKKLETVGRSGGDVLRALVADRRQGGRPHESRREAQVARMLVAGGLPKPVRQYELRRDGEVLARFDLPWPANRIAGEFVSYRHDHGRHAWRADTSRTNRAAAQGWRVFAATEHDVQDGCESLAHASPSPVPPKLGFA